MTDSTEGEDTIIVASVAYTYPMHECPEMRHFVFNHFLIPKVH